jgi:hypothetical protein
MGVFLTDVDVVARLRRLVAPAVVAAYAAALLVTPAQASADTVQRCYFPSSFFCQKVTKAKVDPASSAMVRQLRNMSYGVDPHSSFDCARAVSTDNPLKWTAEEILYCTKLTYLAGINYDDYAPMLYTVGPDQARVPVVLDNNDASLKATLAAGVPIPDEAQAAGGTDGQMIIYQPSTDTMWEFWRASRDLNGVWHATWGGVIPNVSQNPGHYEDIVGASASGGYVERHTWGGPSSSIPNLPGLITVDQLRSGVIGHALVFATWANKPNEWVYPAQRTDGRCRGANLQYCSEIPQGARFRLDPKFDVSSIAHPVVRMMAKAVQDYGMVLNNTTGSGVSFYAEGWRGHVPIVNPYYGTEGLFKADPSQLLTTQFMREFPWERLQMLKRGTTCSVAAAECG